MRIAALTDLHGKKIENNTIDIILKYNPDILVVCGDITHFGNDLSVINQLEQLNKNNEKLSILAIPGNCDNKEAIDKLTNSNLNIDNKIININNINIIGLGGSNKTPFNTPNEYSEEELYNKFTNIVNENNLNKEQLINNFILICHVPPINTMADLVNNNHFGSSAIRKIIEQYKPALTICGHIHESRTIDKIFDSYIVNPSQKCFVICDVIKKDNKIDVKAIELFDL